MFESVNMHVAAVARADTAGPAMVLVFLSSTLFPTLSFHQSGRRLVWVPDAENMWRVASVTSESADGSSYTVIVSGGEKMEVGLVRFCARHANTQY